MIDFNSIDNGEKARIVALYYAHLKSDNSEYVGITKKLEALSLALGMKKSYLKNIKDKYDSVLESGRKGWHQSPLSGKIAETYEKYKNESLSELKKVVNSLMQQNSEEDGTENNEADHIELFFNYSLINKSGKNVIVYGTPGSGKSYYVSNVLLANESIKYIRTTFYQDYSNTDFIGQIIPVIEDNGKRVTYDFNAGPFTLALDLAINNPAESVALVIEEINRGNAPSIFGDIFQLLDRKDGASRYRITNVNVQNYLKKKNPNLNIDYLKIPSNLSIYATMNTSDQNVFTLDTAFKRRWDFIKIKNNFVGHPFKNRYIPGMNMNWEEFCSAINKLILESDGFINSEDKMLGAFFIDGDDLRAEQTDLSTVEKRQKFAYKVLEYLWDDVAKYDRENWFGDTKTLDDLIDSYVSKGENDINGIEIFKKPLKE